jgi:hypothetical protein
MHRAELRFMHRCLPVIVLAVLTLSTGLASAETYLSIGVGRQATVDGSIEMANGDGHLIGGRLMLGDRFGSLAVEGGVFGTQLHDTDTDNRLLSAGIELKYLIGLFPQVEGYAKAGANYSWLQASGAGTLDSGEGYLLGGGLQISLSPASGRTALWLDYTHHGVNLDLGSGAISSVTAGLSFGL